MGSVIENTECPKCSFEDAYSDYYYKSGEEYIFCPRCGYFHNHKKEPENTDAFIIEEGGGFGTLRVSFKNSLVSQNLSLEEGCDIEDLLRSINRDDIAEITISRLKDGKWAEENYRCGKDFSMLLSGKAFRYGGMRRLYERTAKEWSEEYLNGDSEREGNPYVICPNCGKLFPENEPIYAGSFLAKYINNKPYYLFKCICKNCAYEISESVIEADGEEHRRDDTV